MRAVVRIYYLAEYFRILLFRFIRFWIQTIVILGSCSLIYINYGLSKRMLFAYFLNAYILICF